MRAALAAFQTHTDVVKLKGIAEQKRKINQLQLD